MRETIERLMYSAGWMPVERERVMDDLLQASIARAAELREELRLERAKHDVTRNALLRAESSWERAEERVRELESDEVMVNRDRARALLLRDKLAALGRRADELSGAAQ